jgi:hypothetical protein
MYPAFTGLLQSGGCLPNDGARLLRIDNTCGHDFSERLTLGRLGDNIEDVVANSDIKHSNESRILDECGAPSGVERVVAMLAADDDESYQPIDDLIMGRPDVDITDVSRNSVGNSIAPG